MCKRKPFIFKQFSVTDKNSAMKVGTDAVLLGSWVDINKRINIFDIGTGSGVIALMLAQRSEAEITGIDIHFASVEEAKINFAQSKWKSRLKVIHSSFQEYAANCSESYDLIVSNPPFFTNSLRSPEELKNISKHNDRLPYSDLISGIIQLLTKTGKYCLIVPANDAPLLIELSNQNGLYCVRQLTVYPKQSKPASRKIIEFGTSKPETIIKEEVIIRNVDNSYTADYMKLTKDFYLNF